jgi:hypothetical protein
MPQYHGSVLSGLSLPLPRWASLLCLRPFCVSMPKVYLRGDALRISLREMDSFSQTTRKCINIEMKNFRRE